MKKVFLGGTCNNSTWREKIIPMLDIDYFNPVVEDWTEECQENELRERETADFCLYVLTPRMTGVYSVAEVVDDSNKRPTKTVFCILTADSDQIFSKPQLKSLIATAKLVDRNGGIIFDSLEATAKFLNERPTIIE